MDKLIVNAPTQNKEFSPDSRMGKVIPLFVADWLRANNGDYKDVSVDLWNNVLASEQANHTPESYESLMDQRLHQKYESNVLSDIRDITPILLTDADADFTAWSQSVLEKSLENNDLAIASHEVYVCDNCDATLAETTAPCSNGCVSCRSMKIHIETRPILYTVIDERAEKRVDSASHTLHTSHVFRRSIVNRKRLNGISLEFAGFPGDVVDPRIGLGLLALYAAATFGAAEVDVIASRATERQNLPQFYAALGAQTESLPDLHVVPIAKAPANYLLHLRDYEQIGHSPFKAVMKHILPPALLEMQHDMSPARLDQLMYSHNLKKYIAKK